MAAVSLFRKMTFLAMSVQFLLILWLSAPARAAPFPITPGRVRCRFPSFKPCFDIWHLCPLECPRRCAVDCRTCKPVCSCNFPGAVCQDPRFVGGDGVTFYFHGKKDHDFCLVSDNNLHINAHFIGKRNPSLKRNFTWVQSIGAIFDTHKFLVAAKNTSTWDDKIDRLSVSYDDKPVSLPAKEGAEWHSLDTPRVTFTRVRDVNGVQVEVEGNFKVTAMVVPITVEESNVHGYNITNEDCFAHLELGFKFYKLSAMVDGVLGQTYSKNYISKANIIKSSMPVLGGLNKFSSSHIFSTDCPAARFGRHGMLEGKAEEYASMHCSTGMDGTGVVCKK